MFTNLVESGDHTLDRKRKRTSFLCTIAAYALLLFAAGVVSIYSYDAHVDAQSLDIWRVGPVPLVVEVTPAPPNPGPVQPPKAGNQPPKVQQVTEAVAPINLTLSKTPETVGVKASPIPPVTGHYTLGPVNLPGSPGPPTGPTGSGIGIVTGPPKVVITEEAPEPPRPKPVEKPSPTLIKSGGVLNGKATYLHQPGYPPIARAAHASGLVVVAVLIDETGKVVQAHVTSGHPLLQAAAVQAAFRTRFSATLLSGQPVKVQGTINYNFVAQ